MPRSVDTDIDVQPDGRILFSEVDLSEGTGSVAAQANRLNWVQAGGGYVPEFIGGSLGNDGSGLNRYLAMQAQDQNSDDRQLLQLIARGTGATRTGIYGTSTQGGVILQSRTFMDEDGKSSFFQWGPQGPNAVTCSVFAQATAGFGGSNFMNGVAITHNLGKIPSYWAICADSVQTAGPIVPVVCSVQSAGPTVFGVGLFVSNGAGVSVGTVVRGVAFG